MESKQNTRKYANVGDQSKLHEKSNKRELVRQKFIDKLKNDPSRMESYRLKNRERVNKYRRAKSLISNHQESPLEVNNNSVSPYSTASGESKAFTKAFQALPKNIQKAQHIIKKLALKLKVQLIPETLDIPERKKYTRKGYDNLDCIVKRFYENDLVSKQCPGMRDCVTIKNSSGEKEKVQKFVMHMTVEEAREQFRKVFPSQKVSYSKFVSLRPKHVMRMDKNAWNTCLCIYCANFGLICDALMPYFTPTKYKSSEILKFLCCDEKNYECAANECSICADFMIKIREILLPCCDDEKVNYEKWKHGGEVTFMQRKTLHDKTVLDVLNDFKKEFKYYKFHMYVEKVQKLCLREMKSVVSETFGLLLADYSEKFRTCCQNEIQSAYFGAFLLSIFTVVMYIGSKTYSFALISNNTSQTKREVFTCLKLIIDRVKIHHPALNHVNMMTDGSGAQFKNKFNFKNVLFAQTDLGVVTEMHFSPTGHGKSPCDAIGGIVKRGVRRQVVTNKFKVYNASDFVKCTEVFCKKVICFEVTEEDFINNDALLNERWKENVNAVPGTLQYHSFKASNKPGVLIAAKTSLGDDEKEFDICCKEFIKKKKKKK